MKLNPGTLNRRIAIQQLAAGVDLIGQPVNTWSDVAQVWADMRFRSGLESIKGDVETSMARVSVRIRYRTGITAGMRVLHESVAYDIEAVLPDLTGKVYCDLVCVRVQ